MIPTSSLVVHRIYFRLADVWGKAARTALWRDRRGVTAIEYAMIAGVIVIALVTSVTAIGPNLTNIFIKAGAEL
jgi:pilus assembly protein Flp/PilA